LAFGISQCDVLYAGNKITINASRGRHCDGRGIPLEAEGGGWFSGVWGQANNAETKKEPFCH